MIVQPIVSSQGIEEQEVEENSSEVLYVAITSSLKKMGEPCNGLLKKFYFDQMSYESISLEMPYDKETLKTMKYRCMNKLRKLLGQNTSDDIS